MNRMRRQWAMVAAAAPPDPWRSSSHVAALGPPGPELVPHAEHLAGGLVMGGVVVVDASKLAELDVMDIRHRSGCVEQLDPHPHAHVLHLK